MKPKKHGGPRKASRGKKMGRPRTGKFTHSVFCNDDHWRQILAFIEELNSKVRT
jgi:hypothetical protein